MIKFQAARKKNQYFFSIISIPVMRLHRLIIKSSLAVSIVKNLFKPQTQKKERKKKI